MAVDVTVNAADKRRYLDVDAGSRLEEAPRPDSERRERDTVGVSGLSMNAKVWQGHWS